MVAGLAATVFEALANDMNLAVHEVDAVERQRSRWVEEYENLLRWRETSAQRVLARKTPTMVGVRGRGVWG